MHPDRRRELVERPELTTDAVEEMLRVLTPVQLVPRIVAQDATIGGVDIKAGDHATIVLGAANLDPGDLRRAPTTSTSSASARSTSRSAAARTSASGSTSPGSSCGSRSRSGTAASPSYAIAEGAVIAHSPGIRQTDHLPLVWDVTAAW